MLSLGLWQFEGFLAMVVEEKNPNIELNMATVGVNIKIQNSDWRSNFYEPKEDFFCRNGSVAVGRCRPYTAPPPIIALFHYDISRELM